MDYVWHYTSPLGGITLAATGHFLTGLWFDGQKNFGDGLSSNYEVRDLPVFRETLKWLNIYFTGRDPGFTPPFKLKTTPFRQIIFEILLLIPYGSTTTYGQIAKEVARKKDLKAMSAQAVGAALGHNLISLIIPCHRVLDSKGKLRGYAAGEDKKAKLLELEGVNLRHF
ncbi:MAG: methylated-DNA--[Desulfovibrionaceae bacterium]|nr:methylated-DNA--[protein]-cysteine S-methyltransferase [Desulfovibrionaceae bacterium]